MSKIIETEMAEAAYTGLSVVVPTYNSSKHLSRLLESIHGAETGIGETEVLVVDDSHTFEAKTIRQLCEMHGAQFLTCQGNVAAKRNFGITHAKHQIVFFTDSDCEVDSTTLREHAKLFKTEENIGAMYGVVEFVGKSNWVWSVVERSQFLGAYSFAKRMTYAPWGGAGNLSVKRHVLDEIGGFDETFLRAPGGEDVDLGLRINDAGYKIVCNADAVVFHTKETWNTLGRMFRRVFNYGRAHYHLLVKHTDRVGYEYPRLAAVFLFVLVLLAVKMVVFLDWQPLFAGILFILSVMTLQALIVLRASSHSLDGIITEILAHTLDLAFECGILYESLRKLDTRGFWAKMIYAERQLVYERQRKIIQSWSIVVGFLLLLLIA